MRYVPKHKLFQSTTFRLFVLYISLFGSSGLILLGFIYWTTLAVIDRQTTDTIEAELRGLAEQYQDQGLTRLIEVIAQRSGSNGDSDSIYLLTDPELRPLAGNLSEWPKTALRTEGWFTLTLSKREGARLTPHEALASAFVLPGKFHLLVGRDTHDRIKFQNTVIEALVWSLVVVLVLGIPGGMIISRNILRRVDAIAATSREIMRGDLTRRIHVDRTGDEFDRLASSLNDMLDQIENLISGMRAVTDSIGHDLRGPLARLKGRIELTLRDNSNMATYREALVQTTTEADAILSTFNSLISIAHAEAGISQSEMTTVDLSVLAQEAAELYQPVAEDKNIAFQSTVEPDGHIRGHRQLLAQAMTNLLDNAVKYTPSGGNVTLEVRHTDQLTELAIADTGPGVPEKDRERVLERFIRLDPSRSFPGSGLGLSLVAAVAKFHRAELHLEDNAPGLRVRLTFHHGEWP